MEIIYCIILLVLGIPTALYSIYMVVIGLHGLKKAKIFKPTNNYHRFCLFVAARNEESVIGNLIDSLKKQDYPKELIDIYVAPNNCTDNTKDVALSHGALIFEPKGKVTCKGDVLKQFYPYILKSNVKYDAVCIFDADNIVDKNFVSEMNKALDEGVKAAQGYRDSKNPKDSFMAGCQSLYFYIVGRFASRARFQAGLSCLVSGTGFMISRELLETDAINTSSKTEDLEFSLRLIIKNIKIWWVQNAIVYDEQPLDFKTVWNQCRRWSSGMIKCIRMYRNKLRKIGFRGFDARIFCAAPFMQMIAFFISIITSIITFVFLLTNLLPSYLMWIPLASVVGSLIFCMIGSMIVVFIEGKRLSNFKFRTFLFFYIYTIFWQLVNTICYFRPTDTWMPIAHVHNTTIEEINKSEDR